MNIYPKPPAHPRYVVLDSSANMPVSCWGKYRRVAVVEVRDGATPSMISERAKGVKKIVKLWDNLNVGRTGRCAYRRALSEAVSMADDLNNYPLT